MGFGEPLERWQAAITKMRDLVALWDMARIRDAKALGAVIRWRDGGVSYQWSDGREEVITGPDTLFPHLLDRIQPGDVVKPALYVLQRELREELNGVQPDLFMADGQHLRLFIRPTSLLSALWLQFARAIDGDRDYRRCRNCMTWFEVSAEVAVRTSRQFCSDRCRIQAYRHRQENARRLAAEGVPVKAIAQRLESDEATVRGWIASSKTVPKTVPARARILVKSGQRQPRTERKTR